MDGDRDTYKLIDTYVKRRLSALASSNNEPAVRAELAIMRQGVDRTPGDEPKLWGLLFEELPEELMGRGAEPSREEWAIYTALTLYAHHQQGKPIKTENMNVAGESLGAAIARLAGGDKDNIEAVRRRFNAMATSADIRELVNHLRGIIKLLKRAAIPLDYAALARELYTYQFIDGMKSVRLGWGRDFYSEYNKKDKEKGKDEDNAE